MHQNHYVDGVFPFLGYHSDSVRLIPVDLSVDSSLLTGWNGTDMNELAQRIRGFISDQGGEIGYGGYLENRSIYMRSSVFQSEAGVRSLHLGIDFWMDEGKAIYASWAGRIHSLGYNGGYLDYGATLVVEYTLPDSNIFILYGHLMLQDLGRWQPGDTVTAGDVLCHMGGQEENGGWAPHLHVQAIRDIEEWKGDYPGVGLIKDIAAWKERCPDPWLYLMGEPT